MNRAKRPLFEPRVDENEDGSFAGVAYKPAFWLRGDPFPFRLEVDDACAHGHRDPRRADDCAVRMVEVRQRRDDTHEFARCRERGGCVCHCEPCWHGEHRYFP